MDIYHANYRKLLKLIPALCETERDAKFVVPNCPDLNVDVIYRRDGKLLISLSEYFTLPFGDDVADIDLTITVHANAKFAEVLAYRDAFGHRHAYSDETTRMANHTPSLDLNQILKKWLNDLLGQSRRSQTTR